MPLQPKCYLFLYNYPSFIGINERFKDNTLAKFKNFLSEEKDLQGEWRVAVREITLPTHKNNVTDKNIVY